MIAILMLFSVFYNITYEATLKRRQHSYLVLDTRKIYVHLSNGARVFTPKCFVGNNSILFIVL